jgi:hypothetical protein
MAFDKDDRMSNLTALFKVGILVDVKTTDDQWITGYLDEVGMTQYPGLILLASKPPKYNDFKGRRIPIDAIVEFRLSDRKEASF